MRDNFMQIEKVVVDDGSTGTKVAFSENGRLKLIRISNSAEIGGGFADEDSNTYRVGTSTFTYFDACNSLATDNINYQFSEHCVASVHHALHELGFSGRQVELTCTLPISLFYKDGRKNLEAIERKKETLLKKVTHEIKKDIHIVDVSVFPEGIPAVYPLLVSEDGSSIVDSDELTCIADFGGTTLDLALFSGAAKRVLKATSIEIGMLSAHDSILKSLKLDKMRLPMLQNLLEKGEAARGRYVVNRQDVTLSLMERARVEIVNFLGHDLNIISNLFLVGGGAELLEKHLKSAGISSSVVENSTMALVGSLAKIQKIEG
ncbi:MULTISPECIES: plasmid segregation protein ParM domain-containing protein [Vibrio]|uniref:Uncharacterized protein n=1 Tax=Vibrio splendidus TaxID=29497 RepID=A0A2N7JX10_VIBSP|nr:plasmid segregation protein ParM domain-containing protein [Vibrio splendidus]PMM64281.1 hypothetical protein BCT54_17855 [Vibrio splendidus]